MESIPKETQKIIVSAQKNEISEHTIYNKLAARMNDAHNKEILESIASQELTHSQFWQKYSKEEFKPSKWRIWKYYLIAIIFGLTFGLKLMENGEKYSQKTYNKLSQAIPNIDSMIKDEEQHEKQLIGLIKEDKLLYIGAMILGLNDALVELTGALAGFTFALQNPRLIIITGLITGVAAALSMAGSEYFSTKSEGGEKKPGKSALYTGTAYFITVILLILPYILIQNFLISFSLTIIIAILIIYIFNYYIAVVKDLSFRKRFTEMALVSLGIAALSFGIGILMNAFL
jgi:VIT1/CCC1 family predicted Fe2+/Mn2+ transporter